MLFSRWKSQAAGAVGVILLGGQVAQAIDFDVTNTDSIKSAAATVAYDLMKYYTGNQTGMTIGLLPDPYYWWEAGAMFGQMIEYWFYTGDASYNDVVSAGILAQVGDNNDFMPSNQTKTEGNDDQSFWAFAAMSAAEMKFPDPPGNKTSWLALAQAVFNLQVARWEPADCGGGLRWQIYNFNKGYDYKNAISNGAFFQLAARLARYTGNQTYADWADKSYDWIKTTPLFTDQYLIYDGAQIENNCTIASKLQWTYNVGTYLMGAANMYNYTNGTDKWHTEVAGLVNGTGAFFPDQFGGNIMQEIACEPQGTCNYDQPSFKAYLSRWLAATTQIAPFTAPLIYPKLSASGAGAAGQCVGGSDGKTCGRAWNSKTWDNHMGVGEQMSALSIIQANLVSKVAAPVSADTGGTSKSNPAAGSQGDNPAAAADPQLATPVTTADRAGAGILTALVLGSLSRAHASILLNHVAPCTIRAFVALFPKGNRASLAFTTSPSKRRKLSPSAEPVQDSPTPPAITDPASPPPLVAFDGAPPPPSPSPPRYLPPHLFAEGARSGRSPTPEPPNTGASSPSAACAGLNLDSDGSAYGSGQELASGRRRSSLALVGLRGGASTQRTTSPAKRRASAMAGGGVQSEDVDMVESEEAQNGHNAIPSIEVADVGGTTQSPSTGQGSRHKRETSIDMTSHDTEKAAYQTPQSGASSAGSAGEPPTAVDIPSIDDQISQVLELATVDSMKEGQRGYVISSKWLNRVLSRGSADVGKGKDKYGKDAREGIIGPVDNSGIEMITDPSTGTFKDESGDPFIPMKPGLQMNEDFEILPETAWNLIIGWYGMAKGSPTITRYCHDTSPSDSNMENLQYELAPPIFTILKLPDRSSGITHKDLREKDDAPIKVLASRHERIQSFLKRAKKEANIEMKTKVRVWRILGGLSSSPSGVITPAQSRASSPAPGAIIPVDPGKKLVIDVNNFARLHCGSEREDLEIRDETANANYNGKSNLDFMGLRQDSVLVLEEQVQGPGGGEWVSDGATIAAKSNGVPISVTRSGVTSSLKPNAGSRGASPAPGGIMTRGRQTKTGRMKGTTGLTNLGNTCYMNSALQCVRSVEELSMYFLEGCYKKELNPSNALGHNGNVAKAYADLLNSMYGNTNQSFAPRNFKNIIGKYGPSFSGYQQQDSQEFLLFLLDGLQEDLNRVLKKPYIEKPDSTDEMVQDPVALHKLADICWEIYTKRSDSVITDLFAGMYKSTLTCPVCDKVSIIFDPFNNLTLQLPIENNFQKRIQFFPLHKRPIQIDIDIDKNATFFALKEFVASRFPGSDPKRMMAAEVYKHKFFKFYENNKQISEESIAESDRVGVWEVEEQPTNWPPPKEMIKKNKHFAYHANEEIDIPDMESSVADTMMVSIFHRHSTGGGTRYSPAKELFGPPGFVVVTREEAKDYDAILKKVLAYIATMTTRDILREEESSSPTDGDSDTILMNAEDADLEPKLHAESLESEDGMVDISMKDPTDKELSRSAEQPTKSSSMTPLPKMLQAEGEITDAVRDLFEMKIVGTKNEMVPMGWTSLSNETLDFPAMAQRCGEKQTPPAPRRKSAMETINDTINREESTSSDEDDEDPPQIVQDPIVNDSDSDAGMPEVEQLVAQKPVRNKKQLTTYSKKGKQAARRLGGQDESMPDVSEEYFVRLGESILIDWTEDALDSLFQDPNHNDDDGMRGFNTWNRIPTLPDPELKEKKQFRDDRRKNGISLGECLDEFGKPEILSENDAWYCPRCKEHRRASKKFELWKAPDILVIHLKRFSVQGRLRDKIEVRVDFPLEGLDLSSRLAVEDGDNSTIYDLLAVDNHYGGLGGGHYTAYAQNFVDKTWYEYNDSIVTKRSNPQTQVVSSAAYLLFYRRRSNKPLGGPFFEELMATANDAPSESQANSRAASPAGEGKRLDAPSSRIGSSSALRGVGAAHQAGDGGAGESEIETQAMRTRTGVDDDLPAYSENDPGPAAALEGMEVDDDHEDEAVGDLDHGRGPSNYSTAPAWSFVGLQNSPNGGNAYAAGEEDEQERDNDSNKVPSTAGSIDRDRMDDFEGDEDDNDAGKTTERDFGTPPQDARDSDVPLLDVGDDDGDGGQSAGKARIRGGGGGGGHDVDVDADELA